MNCQTSTLRLLAKPNLTEFQIHSQIRAWLDLHGFVHWTDYQPQRKPTRGYNKKKTGSPDINVVLPPAGQFLGIEVKKPGNTSCGSQDLFLDRIRKAGGQAILVFSLDDVIRAFKERRWL
jgi:hypothetical protein